MGQSPARLPYLVTLRILRIVHPSLLGRCSVSFSDPPDGLNCLGQARSLAESESPGELVKTLSSTKKKHQFLSHTITPDWENLVFRVEFCEKCCILTFPGSCPPPGLSSQPKPLPLWPVLFLTPAVFPKSPVLMGRPEPSHAQPVPRQEACWKCRFSAPNPNPLAQNLHLNKTPRGMYVP